MVIIVSEKHSESVRRLNNLINAIENDCITAQDLKEVQELLNLLRPKVKSHE